MEIGLILEHTPLSNRCYKGSWNIGTYNKLTLPFPPYLSPSLSLFLLLPMSHWIYVFLTFLCAICFLCWPFFLLFFVCFSLSAHQFFLLNHFSVSIFQILMSSSSFSSQLHGSPASCVFPLGSFCPVRLSTDYTCHLPPVPNLAPNQGLVPKFLLFYDITILPVI